MNKLCFIFIDFTWFFNTIIQTCKLYEKLFIIEWNSLKIIEHGIAGFWFSNLQGPSILIQNILRSKFSID